MSSNSLIPRRRSEVLSEAPWKSDVNITVTGKTQSDNRNAHVTSKSSNFKSSNANVSYYKKYDYDILPVKEDSKKVKSGIHDADAGDSDQMSLTDSRLDKLEKKIFSNISQELQTDDSSACSLDSNIKIFKTTVMEIFDNFYTSMRDIEIYKKRFDEILAKNKEDAVADMESFIKDIMSSLSNITNEEKKEEENSTAGVKDIILCHQKSDSSAVAPNAKLLESLHSVVEAYKNDNYQTDSTYDDTPSKFKSSANKEETLNIYLINGAPCVQIKMNERHLLSEINIKEPNREQRAHNVASADNFKKLANKKNRLEEYDKQESVVLDREIPVKVSFAKNNITLDEEYNQERVKDENKSFFSQICNYICKKLRRG